MFVGCESSSDGQKKAKTLLLSMYDFSHVSEGASPARFRFRSSRYLMIGS
jgi:hypothetical protein